MVSSHLLTDFLLQALINRNDLLLSASYAHRNLGTGRQNSNEKFNKQIIRIGNGSPFIVPRPGLSVCCDNPNHLHAPVVLDETVWSRSVEAINDDNDDGLLESVSQSVSETRI